MRLPRDPSGGDLAKPLRALGYEVTRQSGSHIRLTTQLQGEHHVTIPNHPGLKIGALVGIMAEVAAHFGMTRENLLKQLFDI